MTAADEIQAAIDKLTEQMAQSTQGPWWAWHPASGRGNSSVDAPSGDPDNPEMPVEGERGDVELIVTLHSTIDAQLAIMRNERDYVLTLARAINGTD